jgi:uncharacterized delta-60 repeat protein
VQRAHRLLWRPTLAVAILALSARIAAAAAGDLDPTFDGDGKKTFGFGSVDVAQALLVQPDGKIVVVAYATANSDIVITRLLPNGDFDATFDGDGTVGIDLGGVDVARAAALQADGKIVVAADNLSVPQGLILRRSADGSPDPTFGSGTFADAGFKVAYAVAIQPDQKIVVAGGGTPSNNVLVARLEANGSFDAAFNLLIGYTSFDFGGADYASAVALQPDGKIVLAGFTSPPGGGEDVVVLRLLPDSSLDASFDGDGTKTIDWGGFDEAHAVAVQPDGKIVVAGSGGVSRTMTVSRLEPDGSLDPTFDADGTAGVDLGDFDGGTALALQPDGKILVAGWTGGLKFAVLRLDPIGSPDPTFGDAGVVVPAFGSEDFARAIAIQADGRILVAGDTSADQDIAVVRLETDPPPTTTTTTTLPPASAGHPIPVSVVVVKPGGVMKLVAKGAFTAPAAADGDPTIEGGSLTLTGSEGSVTYPLPAGSWTALGRRSIKGYRFTGDECTVLLKRRTVKAVCRGATGTLALPDPGPLDVALTIGAGTTRYCGRCGGTARDTERLFSRRRCAAPAACP